MQFQTPNEMQDYLFAVCVRLSVQKCSWVQEDDMQIGNRKQCMKFHWIFKQLKNSKTTSEGVIGEFQTPFHHNLLSHPP